MLSKSGTHAVHAMIALAALPEGSFGGSSAIARQVGAPPNYLGKILQTLAKEGLVVSQKGMGGGWALGRSAAKITLLDIVEPLEECPVGAAASSAVRTARTRIPVTSMTPGPRFGMHSSDS